MNRFALAWFCLALLALTPAPIRAQSLDTLRIASGLPLPVYVTHAPCDASSIYIVLKRGRILRHNLVSNTSYTFLDLESIVREVTSVSDERGLLGLAFHPGYCTNGYFFVYYTAIDGRQVVARYRRFFYPPGDIPPPPSGNFLSATILLNMADSFSNHNGGWMGFAPGDTEGHMYISTGDGGSAGDPNDAGQNLGSLLGKLLRVDVDGADNVVANGDDDTYPADALINLSVPAGNPFVGGASTLDDLIWAYGLRNAWRCSFDRDTGALYIADVGQNNWEEINFQSAGAGGGQNYGWRCYEGAALFNSTGRCNPLPTNVTFPFHTYSHTVGFSVTGGYVYRGCAIPELHGHYLYADYGTARVWSRSDAGASSPPSGPQLDRTADLSPPLGGGNVSSIASFGEDAFGELYIVRHSAASGEVFRIVPQGNPPFLDCNGNGFRDCSEIALGSASDCNANIQIDSCEIAANPALDCNSNSVLDTCEICLGDSDLDGDADFADIGITLSAFGASYGTCLVGPGDADHDGDVDFADISASLSVFGVACR